ncbi:DEAD/DEAH box helicase [Crossiella cryophila]|uniref:DEAD/DEAH box helicase n=1 Tax=Crossiella cryophila TaxID=43355 RepID=UPI0031EE20CE
MTAPAGPPAPLAVHGLWSPGRGLLLWAESPRRPATTAMRPTAWSVRPHPFAAPTAELAALHPGKPVPVTLLLPSRPNGPRPSPDLTGAREHRARTDQPVTLQPWSVPAVLIDPSELDDPAEGIRYGTSVQHLRAVYRLALDLVHRGRVLPTVGEAGNGAHARWRPVLRGLDAVAAQRLAQALPPIGRAEQSAQLDGADPALLVEDALGVLVDTAVRDRLAHADLPLTGGDGPIEVWLRALCAADGRADLPATAHRVVADAIAAWDAETNTDLGEGTVCVRLSELRTLSTPEPGGDPDDQTGDGTHWQLSFHLRAAADPSLLLPAAEVWSGRAHPFLSDPEGLLAAELGRAALVLPMLAPAITGARPSSYDLATAEAEEFLVSGAQRLTEAGFEVQLPAAWGGRRRAGLRLSAHSAPADRIAGERRLSREELGTLRWSVSVGDEVLTEDELRDLVAAKTNLVRLRGQWVSVDAEHLRLGLAHVRRDPHRTKPRVPTVAEVLALLHRPDSAEPPGLPLPITGISTEGWLADLLAGKLSLALRPVELPPEFHGELRDYQRRGVAWLALMAEAGIGVCLADDMGLGKTIQVLALEALERAKGGDGPTLLLCPVAVLGMWPREAARFAPALRVRVHHGPARDLDALLGEADLVVTTYATAARDVDALSRVDWARLVLDEAQTVKNPRTGAARAIRRFTARHRIALTGTPMENGVAELWALLDALNPGRFGSREDFRERFATPIELRGDPVAAAELRRLTRPYVLRRLKTDPAIAPELPAKIELTEEYRLTREQGTLYRTIVEEMMTKIQDSHGINRRGNVLAAITKLKQVCNHPAHLLHDGSPMGHRSGKVARLEELLTDVLAAGDRVLCFTQFTEFGRLLTPHLTDRLRTEIAHLHGGQSARHRDETVERFQSGEGPPVLLASLKAGGSGLTLTAATHVFHLDRWWNPAVEAQATDRAFRIGQHRTVQVRKFLCPGTIEERIDALMNRKRDLADLVSVPGENWLTELSDTSLREMFQLGAEATDD